MEPTARPPSPVYEELGPPEMVLSEGSDGIEHWFPRPGLVVHRLWGVMTIPCVQRIGFAANHNADATPGALVGFGDWSAMTNWDPIAREAVWKVRSPYWHRTEAIHLLVNAVALPLARSAALLESCITVHERRETYDAALRMVLAGITALH